MLFFPSAALFYSPYSSCISYINNSLSSMLLTVFFSRPLLCFTHRTHHLSGITLVIITLVIITLVIITLVIITLVIITLVIITLVIITLVICFQNASIVVESCHDGVDGGTNCSTPCPSPPHSACQSSVTFRPMFVCCGLIFVYQTGVLLHPCVESFHQFVTSVQ